MAQQPSGEFASTDPTARAQDARFQERRVSAKISSIHATTYNIFNVQRHLTAARTHRAFRASALQTWREVVVAA
jgi:putative transposase